MPKKTAKLCFYPVLAKNISAETTDCLRENAEKEYDFGLKWYSKSEGETVGAGLARQRKMGQVHL